jgi:hypothetical protein
MPTLPGCAEGSEERPAQGQFGDQLNSIPSGGKRLHGEHVTSCEGCKNVGKPESFGITLVDYIGSDEFAYSSSHFLRWNLTVHIYPESECRLGKFAYKDAAQKADRVSRKLFRDFAIYIE